jgi:hypothetical protein
MFLSCSHFNVSSFAHKVSAMASAIRNKRELKIATFLRRRDYVFARLQIGSFITLEKPTKPMEKEAVSAGFYEPVFFPGHRFPRLQILTIEELLAGKTLQYPRFAPPATFKRATRRSRDPERQQQLF